MTEKKVLHSCAAASAFLQSMIRFEHGVSSVGVIQRCSFFSLNNHQTVTVAGENI